MGLSKSNSFFCLIRQIEVSASPEEAVRQRLIHHMIGPLGFPRGSLAVEKNLFPFDLERRVDLVCFHTIKDLIKPLLLVECKASSLSLQAENQLFGYNRQIQAPFLCLAGGAAIKTLWQEQGGVRSVPFLPSYEQLIEKYTHLL